MQEDTDMKNISLFATMAAALTICSCSLEKMDSPQSDGSQICISASISAFNTKADASGFESGDSFGLFALDPINAVNIQYTLGADGFSSSSKLTWAAGQTSPTTFIAYYPYTRNISLDGAVSFEVGTDQSSHSAYTASDFMLATAQAKPEEKVSLNFKHLMSRLVFDVSGLQDEVASLSLEGVRTIASADLSKMAVTASGTPGSIKAAPVTLDGKKAWELITVPQTCLPAVKLVTVSGQEYIIPASDSLRFVSGREISAKVRIIESMGVCSFSASVAPWSDGGKMKFEENDGEIWHSLGTGKYIDDVFCGAFSGARHYEWDVEIQECVYMSGYYRLVNPYKNWKYLTSSYSTEGEDSYIYVNATTSDHVFIEESPAGIVSLSREPLYIGSIVPENYFYGYESYGTIDSYKCITFPEQTLFFYFNGNYYYGNKRGQTTITLPGGTRTKVMLDLSGGEHIHDTETDTHYFEFQTSMETKGVYFKVFEGEVSGDLGSQLADQMLSEGKLDWPYYEVQNPDELIRFKADLEAGKTYTGVAFTFDYGPYNYWWYSWRYVTVY